MGFVGKFYILASGAKASAWPLMIVLVLTSVIGLFYYLRIVVTLFSEEPQFQSSRQRLTWGSALVLGGLAVLLVGVGVYPAPLLNLIQTTIGRAN
jgi:NADH-quinone oxidoreductase subunit N